MSHVSSLRLSSRHFMNFLLAKDSDFLSLTTMLIVRIIGGSMGTAATL